MNAKPNFSFAELTAFAADAKAPAFVSGLNLQPGGVDPLGLRQVNFNLMDRALPGLNNAATRLRPYVAVTWAWWKAIELGRIRGGQLDYDVLKNFVDRIEVLFVASHLQAGEMTGLPGEQVINRYRNGANQYDCTSPAWDAFRKKRRNTSLMAPVAYGPSIKVGAGLGFLRTDEEGLMAPMAEVMPAVRAFDKALRKVSAHPALSSLQGTNVTLADLGTFHRVWRTAGATDAEKEVGWRRLYSDDIARIRRPTIDLVLERLQARKQPINILTLRATLARRDRAKKAVQLDAGRARSVWRALQTQQLYRYTLEALLVWVLRTIRHEPASLANLAVALLDHVRGDTDHTFGSWLFDEPFAELGFDPTADPVALVEQISQQSWDEPWVSDTLDGLRAALRIARAEGKGTELISGQSDRLPLSRALQRADLMAELPVAEALEILISEWLIGQHIYWAVGRSGDNTQRLRLSLEEGGWTAVMINDGFPVPTPDRLRTVLSLMADMGKVEEAEGGYIAVA